MRVELRYCAAWGYEPQALSLTAAVLNALKQKVQSWTLVPSRGGCFELTVDGELIHSKLETDVFPREADILARLSAHSTPRRWPTPPRGGRPDPRSSHADRSG